MSAFETPTPKCDAALARLAEFADEPTNPEARILTDREMAAVAEFRATLHPVVKDWVLGFAKHAPKSKHEPELIAAWVALGNLCEALAGDEWKKRGK